MKNAIHNSIRLLVLLALLLTSAVAFAQDETATDSATVPFIGLRFAEADEGVLVTGVLSNTPAAAAGIETGDVITAIDGTEIDAASIQEVLWAYSVGDTVALSMARGGESFEQDVTLMARPDDLFDNPEYQMVSADDLDGQWLFVGGIIKSAYDETGFVTCGTLVWRYHGDTARLDEHYLADERYSSNGEELESRSEYYLIVQFYIEGRRQPPRRRHPRTDISRAYQTESISLGYGDGFIEVQQIDQEHELYEAGLRQFDLIVAANGAPIEEAEGLFSGDVIALGVERGGESLALEAPTSAAPLLMFGQAVPVEQNRAEWLDLPEKQVSLGLRYLQLESGHPYFGDSGVSNGAYVAEVIEGLPAEAAGIQVGDVIVAVDGLTTTPEIDLRNRIYAHRPGDEVTLDVLRDGELMQIDVALRVASS